MTLLPKFGRYPAIAGKAAGEPVAKPAILFECAGFCFFGNRVCKIVRTAEGGDELINTPDPSIIFTQIIRSSFLKGETTMKHKFSVSLTLALILAMLVTSLAVASDIAVSVVDVTAPTGSVTLQPGQSAPIVINLTVTGNQEGDATFNVYRDWILFDGTFTGSNPQTFPVPAGSYTGGSKWTASTTGIVTVAAGEGTGAFTLAVSAFGITNSNQQGAKLSDGADSNYQVTVTAPPPPSDSTPPVISYTVNGVYPEAPDGLNDWYVSNAFVDWTVDDPESSFVTTGCDDTLIDYDTTGVTLSCEATSAGGTTGPVSVTIKRDATAPVVSVALDRSPAPSSWFNEGTGAPIAEFTCSDATSGVATCPDDYTFGEGANQSYSGTAYDNAGNSASASVSGVNVDLTAPGITWYDVQDFYYGFPPATSPSCQASDGLSGPNGCAVTGYNPSAGTGTHSLTATAYDVAGNMATDTNSYTVMAWTLNGFYRPVEMGGVWNTVKGGSTVPLKFNVFAGTTELTDVGVVKSFTAVKVACEVGGDEDPVDFTTTGGTSLRYDWTDGQFIQNWKTPKSTGCYRVTMTTQDLSTIVAFFKLK